MRRRLLKINIGIQIVTAMFGACSMVSGFFGAWARLANTARALTCRYGRGTFERWAFRRALQPPVTLGQPFASATCVQA